jgi:hypothetical protein
MEAAYFYLPTDPSKSLIGEKKKIQAVWIEREIEGRPALSSGFWVDIIQE